MKIVISSFTYWPKTDGVQTVTQYQAEGLTKLGHNVCVVTPQIFGHVDNESYNGVKIVRVPWKKIGLWGCGDAKAVREIFLKEIAGAQVWLDVCYFDFLSQCLLPVVDKIHLPKVCMLHGIWQYGFTKMDVATPIHFLKKIIQDVRWREYFQRNKRILFTFDRIIHLHEKDESLRYSLANNYHNNEILYNAVEDVFFKLDNDKKSKKPFIFLQVANYSSCKNQEYSLECFYEAGIPDAELWFVGSQKTTYYEKLLRKNKAMEAKYLAQSKVRFWEGVSREKIYEFMGRASVVLISSIHEHFPMVLLEGMAAGIPFVATNVGIVPYLPGGLVCKTKKEFISVLRLLYETGEKRDFLGIEGRNFALEYCSRREQVKRLEQILQSVCSD